MKVRKTGGKWGARNRKNVEARMKIVEEMRG
jgi:hypothetical protein